MDFVSFSPSEKPNVGHTGQGDLQKLVDVLFATDKRVDRLDAVVLAETNDVESDLLEIVSLLPPKKMTRAQMTDQLNSSLAAHGWTKRFGIVS